MVEDKGNEKEDGTQMLSTARQIKAMSTWLLDVRRKGPFEMCILGLSRTDMKSKRKGDESVGYFFFLEFFFLFSFLLILSLVLSLS